MDDGQFALVARQELGKGTNEEALEELQRVLGIVRVPAPEPAAVETVMTEPEAVSGLEAPAEASAEPEPAPRSRRNR